MNKLFPCNIKGCLENSILSNIELTKGEDSRIRHNLFSQIIFPMCDIRRSGIRGYPRNSH